VSLVAGGSMLACTALSRTVDEPPMTDVQAPEAGLTGHH
jgi:hypothetical protein